VSVGRVFGAFLVTLALLVAGGIGWGHGMDG
jgi:hypothetical protein